MAEPTNTLGWKAAIKINDTEFGVTATDCTAEADEHECGDSLSGRFKKHKGGRRMFSGSWDFQSDPATLNHADPLNIQEGDEISFQYYPDGLENAPYDCPSFIVFRFNIKHDINGKVVGSISGKANGEYTKPGEGA